MLDKKLGRTTSHRTAMYKNMATSLIRYEQIKTTQAKARNVKSFVEKLITLAKKNDLVSKRMVRRDIQQKDAFYKLFDVIAPRYVERNGGYIRIIKLENRPSDNAPMCIMKLIA